MVASSACSTEATSLSKASLSISVLGVEDEEPSLLSVAAGSEGPSEQAARPSVAAAVKPRPMAWRRSSMIFFMGAFPSLW